ncbi:MAG: hypothetical protein QOD75_993 [Blastocatellia bacterium]|jgi:hypothetical protein|nr:hypothetical protein [Blastocatellia bacterium]
MISRSGYKWQAWALVAILFLTASAAAQGRRRSRQVAICGNPQIPCKTSVTFKPYDLPFRVPETAVIYDPEPFYAIVLKSVPVKDDDCEVFISESDRLAAQGLWPDHKVFTDRCYDIENLFYTNVNTKRRFMGAYAGRTLAEAKRFLETVKATGKYPGANLRKMRTAFNGT